MNHKINELIEQFPDIEWDEIDRDTLVDIAKLFLRQERAKFYADVKVPYIPEQGRAAVAVLERRNDRSRERMAARQTEQRVMFDREKVKTAVSNRISEITRETMTMISSDWTELLSTTFALPDGTRVLFADATIDQHRARAEYLRKTAQSRVQTAALHEKAIHDILAAGVATLGEAA